VSEHGELIASLANDAWFGDSWEPYMHFAATKLRAVENRRFIVRAATSGISAIVDPLGRVQIASAPMSPAELLGRVWFRRDVTLYQRIGNAPWWIASGVLVAKRRPLIGVHFRID
jgi:apolipoprotein N-acyltransferase